MSVFSGGSCFLLRNLLLTFYFVRFCYKNFPRFFETSVLSFYKINTCKYQRLEKNMTSYSFDNKSLFKGEKRWFPIMGEIHYSRYPDSGWKEAACELESPEDLLAAVSGGVPVRIRSAFPSFSRFASSPSG